MQDGPSPSLPSPRSRSALTSHLRSQVLVVRTDLGMTKGKIAAQCWSVPGRPFTHPTWS